jgi:hypothetical protein
MLRRLETESYVAELLDELPDAPGAERILHFPQATTRGGHDGLMLRISPAHSSSWIGIFQFDDFPLSALAVADETRFYVVSKGIGYLVTADAPEEYQLLRMFPIVGFYTVPDSSMVILHDFTDVYAMGPNGVIWHTGRLATDDVRITEVDAHHIKGTAFYHGAEVSFVIDVQTGHYRLHETTSR